MACGPRKEAGYVQVGGARTDDPHAYAQAVLTLPATFSLVYESGDGRLCVFEDAKGHLTAVDTTRLA